MKAEVKIDDVNMSINLRLIPEGNAEIVLLKQARYSMNTWTVDESDCSLGTNLRVDGRSE